MGLFAQLFFGILNYFSNKVVKKPKKKWNTQLKLLVLHRKCRRKVLLPDTNFTNTQLKSSNTQSVLTFKDKYPIPQKLVCFSVLLLKGARFLYFYFMKLWWVNCGCILYFLSFQHLEIVAIKKCTFSQRLYYIFLYIYFLIFWYLGKMLYVIHTFFCQFI